MRLLIDGYNLLHATDLFGEGELAGTLRGSREALIEFLASRLTANERKATVIVFDAADAPPGLPDSYRIAEIGVRFARGFPDADSMIESLLERKRHGKGLTVVSGDRRVQRAARSSGATWVDSTDWFADLRARWPEAAAPEERPKSDPGAAAEWIARFSDPTELAAIEQQAAAAPPPRPLPPPPESPVASDRTLPAAKQAPPRKNKRRRPPLSEQGDKPVGRFGAGLESPFPPGYADDLLDPTSDTGDDLNSGDDPAG